jgi:hypothetical protein
MYNGYWEARNLDYIKKYYPEVSYKFQFRLERNQNCVQWLGFMLVVFNVKAMPPET